MRPTLNAQVNTPAAPGAAAATRPSSPKPTADKDTVVKKSPKLLSLDNLHDDHNKGRAENTKNNEDGSVTLAPMIRVFDQENINDLWHMYADSIRDTKGGVASLMEIFLPVVTDVTITVTMESDMQKNQFLTILMGLKNFLYSHLGIHPDLQLDVARSQENSAKFYTPQDKLKRLIELNPALKRFQKELGLDLDYD